MSPSSFAFVVLLMTEAMEATLRLRATELCEVVRFLLSYEVQPQGPVFVTASDDSD